MKEYPSQFTPASKTRYSNANFILLGYIIEDITGISYAKQLQQRIVKPMQLTHTYYGDGINSDNEATSFHYSSSEWEKLPETDMSVPGGAGGIVSTAADMTNFLRALFNGELISRHSRDQMTDIKEGLGMGLMKFPFYSTNSYGHRGRIDGFESYLLYMPERDVGVGISSNAVNYKMNDVMIGILSIYFDKDFKIPSLISLSDQQMKMFEGYYESEQLPININVFIENGILKEQATGQRAFPLTPSTEKVLRNKALNSL